MNLDNIQKKEEILNKAQHTFADTEELLEKWETLLPEIEELVQYYGSELWHKDYEASNRGEFPEGFPHGVLSEDGIYDALFEQRQLALKMIKLGTKLLEI